ncbi:UNVERIFIED_CONTAM: hypothetical protein Sradi_7229900 [Sesamum radiatum]|uniref:DUF4283 domain-containing protein n=1 Tax=Sesamum radiatum TaxID=300843 RepID=A0AAW2IN38_SESRA
MRVFKWTPTFTPSQESSIVPIWVSFPELPAHLYRKDALYAVASMVGNPLQIDDYTFNQSKLSKARMCVEIDLLNPIIEEFNITIQGVSIKQKVEFDEIPKYCSLCKHVGHKDADCYSKGKAPKPPPHRQNEGRKQNTEGATLQQKQFRGKTKVYQVLDDRLERSHIHMEQGECSKDGELQTDTPNFRYATSHNNMQLAICKSTVNETQVFPNAVDVDDLITVHVDEQCEGVAMEAPLQCQDVVPLPPNPCNTSVDDNHDSILHKTVDANVDENDMECNNCTNLVPLSPNPFAVLNEENVELLLEQNHGEQLDNDQRIEGNQPQICTLNEAAKVLLSPPENYYDFENEFIRDQEEELVEIISDHSSKDKDSDRPASPSTSLEDCAIRGKHKRSTSIEGIFSQVTASTLIHPKCKKRLES